MADYAFRTIGDRLEIQRLWEQGYSPKEIAGTVGKSLDVVYTELSRGRDRDAPAGPAPAVQRGNLPSGRCNSPWSGGAEKPESPPTARRRASKDARKENRMGQEEPKGRRAFRKILEDRNEKMRRLLMKMEAEDAKREAKDAAREQRAIREAVEETKTFREYLEAEGISYTTLLHLIALQEDMSSLAHNILLGYEHGEGWPSGT